MHVKQIIDICQMNVHDVIQLHKDGVISDEELLNTGWKHRQFGDIFTNYLIDIEENRLSVQEVIDSFLVNSDGLSTVTVRIDK